VKPGCTAWPCRLGRAIAAAPCSAGRKTGKRPFERVFHFAIDLVREVLSSVSEPGQYGCNARQPSSTARSWPWQGFHTAALDFDLVSESDPASENDIDESATLFFQAVRWPFRVEGWEKGNFGNLVAEGGCKPCVAWLRAITSEGNLG